MPYNRSEAEELLPETEFQHRMAHRWLKSIDRYLLWTGEEVEAKKVPLVYAVDMSSRSAALWRGHTHPPRVHFRLMYVVLSGEKFKTIPKGQRLFYYEYERVE